MVAVKDKIQSLIEQGKEQATRVLTRLTTELIHDEVVPIGPGSETADRVAILEDGASLAFLGGDDRYRTLHPHAATQLGTRLGLNGPWLRNVTAPTAPRWQRELAGDAIQTYVANTRERDRLLFRSVDTQIRGVLSDQYRRLDSPLIAGGFAHGISRVGAVPYQAHADDLRWSLRAILPHPVPIDSPHHDRDTEIVGAAVVIENSDFGMGALDLHFEVLRLWCVNGAMGFSRMRQVHLGRKLPDDLRLTEETYVADSKAQALLVRDTVAGMLEPGEVEKRMGLVNKAAQERVQDPEAALGRLSRAKRLTKTESERIEHLVTNRDGETVPEGKVTRWTLAQAVSAAANEAPTMLRRSELQTVAGELLGMGKA